MRTIFVGDVHGCSAEFGELLARVEFHRGRDRLLLTGDAFARGPDPLGVWRIIQETGAEMVLGNHDDRLRSQLGDLREGRPVAFKKDDHRLTFERLRPVALQLSSWLEELPLYITTDRFLLVHAGIDPEKGLEGTTRDQFLAIRLWPPAKGIEGTRWHAYYRPQDRLLIFGHDAPGGLVVRRRPDGRPYLIGLDSGCVYGNQLSAYILEEDRIAQVDCRRPGGYWNPGERE